MNGRRRAPRSWVRLAGVGLGGCVGYSGATYNTSAAGLRRIHAPQRAHRACYLTAVTVQGGVPRAGAARRTAQRPSFWGQGPHGAAGKSARRAAGMAGKGLRALGGAGRRLARCGCACHVWLRSATCLAHSEDVRISSQ